MPCGITQYQMPPGRGSISRPSVSTRSFQRPTVCVWIITTARPELKVKIIGRGLGLGLGVDWRV